MRENKDLREEIEKRLNNSILHWEKNWIKIECKRWSEATAAQPRLWNQSKYRLAGYSLNSEGRPQLEVAFWILESWDKTQKRPRWVWPTTRTTWGQTWIRRWKSGSGLVSRGFQLFFLNISTLSLCQTLANPKVGLHVTMHWGGLLVGVLR